MERKQAVPMALALGAALFYLAVLNAREREVIGQGEVGRVLVAKVDIPERTLVKEDLVETAEVPRRYMAQDAFEVRLPSDVRLAANLVTRVRIPKGNQLSQSALAPVSPEAGLSVRVPPGYRGAVLPIDPGMRRLLKPGDRVDIVVTFDALMSDGRREKATATILQNVLVLAVGSDLGQGRTAKQLGAAAEADERLAALSDKPVISVAVNPHELQYLALAVRQGETAVGVRASGDRELHAIPMSVFSGLFK